MVILWFFDILNFLKFGIFDLQFSEIEMGGISGGGWLTHLLAAMLRKIRKSFAMSGGYAMRIKELFPNSAGDYEQGNDVGGYSITPIGVDGRSQPNILYKDVVSYMDLYVMASDNGRTAVNILNKNDLCCFDENHYQYYVNNVREQVSSIEGSYHFFQTEHSTHSITNQELDIIKSFLD